MRTHLLEWYRGVDHFTCIFINGSYVRDTIEVRCMSEAQQSFKVRYLPDLTCVLTDFAVGKLNKQNFFQHTLFAYTFILIYEVYKINLKRSDYLLSC